MPDSAQLTWVEISEFKGLWNRDSVTCPPEYCTVMKDCYPVPGGGLRAFFTESPFADNNMSIATRRKIVGTVNYDALNDMPVGFFQNGTGADSSINLVTANRNSGVVKWFQEINSSASGTQYNWVVLGAPTVLAGAMSSYPRNSVAWVNYFYTGATHLMLSVANNGLQGGFTHATYGGGYPIAVHQDRFVAVDSANPSTLKWTDPGGTTFPGGNTLTVAASTGTAIALLAATEPGDLLVGKADGTFFLIQGDLANPVVREMARFRALGGTNVKWVRLSDGRIAFMADAFGVGVIDPSGAQVDILSLPLDPTYDSANPSMGADTAWTRGPAGHLSWVRPFLVAPQGHIYDIRSGAWFQCSALKDVDLHNEIYDNFTSGSWFDAKDGLASVAGTRFYDAGMGDVPPLDGFTVTRVFMSEEADTPKSWYLGQIDSFYPEGLGSLSWFGNALRRAPSYTFTTAPFRAPGSKQLELREVKLIVRPESPLGNKTVTVSTSTGQTQSLVIPAGNNERQILPFYFRTRSAEMLITVTVSTDAAQTGPGQTAYGPGQAHHNGAAPMIEAMGIGWQPGHSIRADRIYPNPNDGYWKLGLAGRTELGQTAVLG